MPIFSESLEQSVQRALAIAGAGHHEYATLEHLLLALTDDADANTAILWLSRSIFSSNLPMSCCISVSLHGEIYKIEPLVGPTNEV